MGFGKDKKGVIFRQEDLISLGTLVSETAVKQSMPPAMTDSFRMIKSEGTANLEFAAQVEGDGPIELLLASDDLSVAEITEVVGKSDGQPLSRDDIDGGQVTLRPVWSLGLIPFVPQSLGLSITMSWSKTIRWTFGDSAGFTLVARNVGSGVLTTGAFLRFRHTAFGLWVGA